MKKILLLLSAGLLGGQHIYAQAVKTVSGLRFYEHHSSTMNGGADFGAGANGAQSGYDFVKRTYFNSFDPKVSGGEYKKGEEANIDMVEHNGIFGNGGNFGFTSGVSTIWGGPIKGNSTTLWMNAPSTFNYGALADAKTIAAAYDVKKAKKSVEAVAEGGIYLAQIRGSKLYVAMRCFNVRNISSPSGKADVYFDFEYKYGEVSATSVAELGNHSSLSVYPNPATGSVVISNTLSAVLQTKIVSLYGQEVTAFTLEANSSRTVDMSAMSAGLYFVSCTSADGATETYKLVKQ